MMRRRIYTDFINKSLKKNKKYPNQMLLSGKTIIITGGNSGIGEATVLELAKLGARIIMACRNLQKAEVVKKNIEFLLNESYKAEGLVEYSYLPKYPDIVVKHLDLADLNSVKTLADDIIANETRIDVLINNGGSMQSFFSQSTQGFENTWATNHLGHFYLTLLLLPLICKTAKNKLKSTENKILQDILNGGNNHAWDDRLDLCLVNTRVVMVSSALHKYVKLENIQDIDAIARRGARNGDKLDFWQTYDFSKLCNIFFANELTRRLNSGYGLEPYLKTEDINVPHGIYNAKCPDLIPIVVNSLHPGIVVTDMSRNLETPHKYGKILYQKFGWLFCKTPYLGCQASVYCAIAPELNKISGQYFGSHGIEKASSNTINEKYANALWNYSINCINNI